MFPDVDFLYFRLNAMRIDGTNFDTRTGNISLEPTGTPTAVLHSGDILGMPIRIGRLDAHGPGGRHDGENASTQGDGGFVLSADLFIWAGAEL
jgi:hypothetical protein